jgi:hypothetical protein
MTPLYFTNPSPPSGWVEDLHLQAIIHARHTRVASPGLLPGQPSKDETGEFPRTQLGHQEG